MAKHGWIQSAVKHPGAEKAAAKRNGLTTLQEAVREAKSPDPSIRSRGNLAKRFIKGSV